MTYLLWGAIPLAPYWLGPIVVWWTQRQSTQPALEPFDPTRAAVPEDIAAALRQTGDALAREGFRLVAWLKSLERDQPFELTGIGFDWVEGRFIAEIREPGALAKSFYAFCPDIVDQGAETVAAPARELRRSRTLYCWWD